VERVFITGMGINLPLGDTLDGVLANLLAGKSALSRWKFFDPSGVYSKVGADLSDYDVDSKLKELSQKLPTPIYKRLKKLVNNAPFSTRLGLLCAADAFLHAGLDEQFDSTRAGVIVGGHNLHYNYDQETTLQFLEDSDFIDPLLGLVGLDTDQAASVGEAFGLMGPLYTLGGACASGNIALRQALTEIRGGEADMMMVVGPVFDFSSKVLHALAMMGAIAHQRFNDSPAQASRPFDTQREGFVPAHGAAVLILESETHAQQRGAKTYAELLEVATFSDGSHLPTPSLNGQVRTMQHVLKKAGIAPQQIDYINAHATSTPLGDVSEIQAIKQVFGDHAYNLKINATKSMLGHCCWSAPVVEAVVTILQMNANCLHPSINVDELDPEIDLDVCANQGVEWEVNYALNNAFGFGGINCVSLWKKVTA
jgi:3-oxoacyl-(acyl-carrier-protein) synthase